MPPFDPTNDGGGDGTQTIHLMCPKCECCNHIFRERPKGQDLHLTIAELEFEDLMSIRQHFPKQCEECNSNLELCVRWAAMIVVVKLEKVDESDTSKRT